MTVSFNSEILFESYIINADWNGSINLIFLQSNLNESYTNAGLNQNLYHFLINFDVSLVPIEWEMAKIHCFEN
jgi:hypothetical protein